MPPLSPRDHESRGDSGGKKKLYDYEKASTHLIGSPVWLWLRAFRLWLHLPTIGRDSPLRPHRLWRNTHLQRFPHWHRLPLSLQGITIKLLLPSVEKSYKILSARKLAQSAPQSIATASFRYAQPLNLKKNMLLSTLIHCCLPLHLLKIQRTNEVSDSGGNLLRSTQSEWNELNKINKISCPQGIGDK